MDQILLEDIRVYANHGCMEEEEKIGSDYIVNLTVNTNLDVPAASDNLEEAVDYVDLLRIVEEEMAIRSKLLEHVGDRIVTRILNSMMTVSEVVVKVAKQNPPINGNIAAVTIVRKGRR